jgi:hypothetical protein
MTDSLDRQGLTLAPQLAHEHTVEVVDDLIFQLSYSTLTVSW